MEINPQGTSEPVIETPEFEQVELQSASIMQQESVQDAEIHGLSQEEHKDPNKISITIADKQSPIVVLFGPPACGKTMTLVRLTRYLKQNGYRVEPVASFRPSADTHYAQMCTNYSVMINSDNAADSTSNLSFMLVKVIDGRGTTVCQILEAPGEYYFDPNNPQRAFPKYVHAIKNGSNRKIWCFIVEPDWKDQPDRDGYVDKIKKLKTTMKSSDKAIFLFNKIDLTPFVKGAKNINVKGARKEVENLYPGIFNVFQSTGILFGKTDEFKFVPFQTGDYSQTFEGGYTFESGPDEYPQGLWNAIKGFVRG